MTRGLRTGGRVVLAVVLVLVALSILEAVLLSVGSGGGLERLWGG